MQFLYLSHIVNNIKKSADLAVTTKIVNLDDFLKSKFRFKGVLSKESLRENPSLSAFLIYHFIHTNLFIIFAQKILNDQ